MKFWHEEAQELQQELIKFITHHPHRNGPGALQHISRIAQSFAGAREKAVDAAAKLISFQSPKLASIDVKQKNEHRFVIRAPMQAPDTKSWLKEVTAQQGFHVPHLSSNLQRFDKSDALMPEQEIEELEPDDEASLGYYETEVKEPERPTPGFSLSVRVGD